MYVYYVTSCVYIVRITDFNSQKLLCLGVPPSKHHAKLLKPEAKPDVDLEDHLQQQRTLNCKFCFIFN